MDALPEELIVEIAARLDAADDLWALSFTCRRLKRIACDSRLWKRVRCSKRLCTSVLEFAATRGNGHAAFVLGSRLHFEAVDIAGAVHWYKIAESLGSAAASYNLGCLLDKGVDSEIERDPRAANEHFREAALQGFPAAQNALAINFELGLGTVQSTINALFWYRKAAEAGLSDALFNLGLLHFYGKGVPQNYLEAHKYFLRASRNDRDSLVWCQRVARLIDEQQH